MATNPLPGEEDPKKRRASGAPQQPIQPSQPLSPESGRALGQMQGMAARAVAKGFAPPSGPRPLPKPSQPGVTLGSVLAGGPGTAEVGGFRVSNLPDYSNAPAQPGSGGLPALARAALTGPGVGDAAAAAVGMMGRNPTLQPQHLPDYSNGQPAAQPSPPSNPQVAQQMQAVAGRAVANALPPSPLNVTAPAPSASAAGAQGGYDQIPPDRVQQEIAARAPLLNAPGGSDTAGRLVDSGLNVARGFGKLALGGAEAVVAPVLDTARNGITRLAGGDPETLPGGSSGFFNSAMANVREGWGPIAAGGQQIGAGVRGLLGAQPAQAQGRPEPASAVPGQASQSSTPSTPKKPAAPAPAHSASGSDTAQPGQEPPAAGQSKGLGFRQTGVNGVVGRRNAQGVMEFSNAAGDVAGASSERLGIGNIGDGNGSFSQGQAGDSRLALDRFERANAERARMVQASRGGIGDTGNFTVVADGTRGSQEDRDMEARRRLKYGTDVAMERNRLEGQQLRQNGINSYLDRQLREREVATKERRSGIEDQVAQQGIQKGEMDLAQQQRLTDLYTRYQQAAPEERAALAEQIRTMTGKEAPNRFTVVPGGQEWDAKAGMNGAMVNRPSSVLNNQTGQFVGQGQAGSVSGMTLVGHKNGNPVYRDAKGKLHIDG